MLYVQDSDGSRWLEIVELLSEREDYDMVLCLYPGSDGDSMPDPFTVPATPPPLERISTYPEDSEPRCSARARVSEELIDILWPNVDEFEDWGDSLVLYPLREWAWVAAFIPHERLVLVRDDRLYGFLDAADIPVRREAPDVR